MTNPSPVQKVFKVVKVQLGRMFSANQNGDLADKAQKSRSEVIEYFMDKKARPQNHLRVLFACPTEHDAQLAAVYFGGNGYDVRILECEAQNVRPWNEDDQEVRRYRDNFPSRYWVRPSPRFSTVICDSLTPVREIPLDK